MFNDRSVLERCVRRFALPVLEYCSAVWFSAANAHLKLLDGVVSGAGFLNGDVIECTIAHRRSACGIIMYAVCIRSGLTRCTILMELYLCRMCQCGIQEVPWQGLLQLHPWVSANRVLKDSMINIYLGYRILMKY